MSKPVERLIKYLTDGGYGVTKGLDDPDLLSVKEKRTGKIITLRVEKVWNSKELIKWKGKD